MADTNNRQFSVMVDNGGVLSYPQNFITANSLAKFGSDVNGTFKQINLGSEDINPSTITVNSTKNPFEDFGYNTDLIISNNSYGECNLVLCANCGGGYNQNEFGIIRIYSEPAVMQCNIDLIAYKEGAGAGFITLKSFNTDIYCAEQFTVTANSAALPANTTIGGKSVATGVPSNMVTTDTEQTITGRKTFEGETGVYKLTQYSRMIDGDSNISSIYLGYNYTEINAKNEGIYINSDNVIFGDNSNNLDAGNIGKQMLTIQPNEIIFGVPYVQRVYSANTYKWTETLKYTYLSKDVNGNVTFAISDSLPKEVSFAVATSPSSLTSATSSVSIQIVQAINNEGEEQFDFDSQGFETGIQVKFVVNNNSSFESSSNIYSDYLIASSKDVNWEYVAMTYSVAVNSENITIAGQTLDVSSIWPTSVPRIYGKFIVYRNGELLIESRYFQIRR